MVSWAIRWAGHVVRISEMRNKHTILVVNSKDHFEDTERRIILKLISKEEGVRKCLGLLWYKKGFSSGLLRTL
jgi:hypothetical protein